MFNGIIQTQFERVLNHTEPFTLSKSDFTYIFPFDLKSGYITNTELGINKNINIEDYSTFQRIFTGRENLIAKWTNSEVIENNDRKDNIGGYYFDKYHKIGKFYKGYTYTKEMGAIFSPSPMDHNFIQQANHETQTFFVKEEFYPKDNFKLYIVLQFSQDSNQWDSQWYYASDIQKFRRPDGSYFGTLLTLTSLNTKLAETGQAIDQLIQRGAPGEGYAWPFITQDNKVEVDPIKILPPGASAIQISYNGAGAIASIGAFGRPAINPIYNEQKKRYEGKIYAPRLLLPYFSLTPTANPVFTKQGPESDYFFAQGATPQLETTYQDWNKAREAQKNPALLNAYEGLLNLNQTLSDLEDTNPSDQTSNNALAPRNTLWSNEWKVKMNGWKIKSTQTTNAEVEFSDQHYIRYALGGSSIAGELDLDSTNKWIKTDYIQLKDTNTPPITLTIPQFLAHNIFIQKKNIVLPTSIRHNTIWSLRNIPVIGGILSHLTGGIWLGWKNSNVQFQMEPIPMLVPTTMVRYGQSTMAESGSGNSVRIPLELFAGKSDFASAEYGGIPAINAMLKVGITDRFALPYNGEDPQYLTGEYVYVFNTNDLGQILTQKKIYKKDDLQTVIDIENIPFIPIQPNPDDPQYLKYRVFWNGKCYPVEPERDATTKQYKTYIIDTLFNYVLSKVDFQWNVFNGDTEIFTTTQKSFSNFTGNIRDWNNVLKSSVIEPTNIKPMRYPADFVQPNHPDIPTKSVEIIDFENLGYSAQGKQTPIITNGDDQKSDRKTPQIWDLFFDKTNSRILISIAERAHLHFDNWSNTNDPIDLAPVYQTINRTVLLPNNWQQYQDIKITLDNGTILTFNIVSLVDRNPHSQIVKNVATSGDTQQWSVNNATSVWFLDPLDNWSWWNSKTGEEWKLKLSASDFQLKYTLQVDSNGYLSLSINIMCGSIQWKDATQNYTFSQGNNWDKANYSLPYDHSIPSTIKIKKVVLYPN